MNRPPAPAAPDDAALVAAARAGDRTAYQTLYRRHLPSVFARVTRIVGPVPEREDLVQHVFIDLHRALPKFRGEARFSTFLHRIAVNVACDHLERMRRERRVTAPLEGERAEQLVAPAPSPEAQARQRQELASVLAHLEALRPKKRVAFVLVVVEGLSLAEAGEILGAHPDAVKQRVLAARRELAARLERAARREESP
jgi:RNA polymerase sigma-70 factor (ECF subfamily)